MMNFICPYCGHHSTITDPNFSNETTGIDTSKSKYEHIELKHLTKACPNRNCKELSLSISLIKRDNPVAYTNAGNRKIINTWELLPSSKAKPQPDYIPIAIRQDYYEACSILDLSPKASATLSRRCLQGIVRDFWDIPKNKRGNLGAELSFIKKNVDHDTWDGIEAIRSVGDIGAHMEKDVNYVVDVEKSEAELLIDLIEMLFADWYVARSKRQERANKAKELAKKKLTEKQEAKKLSQEDEKEKSEES